MKQIRAVATTLATSCFVIYLLLQWKEIYSLFPPSFVLLIKQVLVMTLFATIAVNPNGVVHSFAKMAPKILEIISIFVNLFNPKKKNDGTDQEL